MKRMLAEEEEKAKKKDESIVNLSSNYMAY